MSIKLTTLEQDLILGSSSDFYVLDVTNQTDSIFLRQQSQNIAVDEIRGEVIQKLIDRMQATLISKEGVGLAAPQVGIGRNLFLFMRLDKPGNPVEVAINPLIIRYSEDLICFEHDGCLSIPNLSGNTERYAWIEVEYYNRDGVRVIERLNGGSRDEDFTGIIFQHEFDHLNGILFIDRLVHDSQ